MGGCSPGAAGPCGASFPFLPCSLSSWSVCPCVGPAAWAVLPFVCFGCLSSLPPSPLPLDCGRTARGTNQCRFYIPTYLLSLIKFIKFAPVEAGTSVVYVTSCLCCDVGSSLTWSWLVFISGAGLVNVCCCIQRSSYGLSHETKTESGVKLVDAPSSTINNNTKLVIIRKNCFT